MPDLTTEVAMVCPSTVEWSTFIVGSNGDEYEVLETELRRVLERDQHTTLEPIG